MIEIKTKKEGAELESIKLDGIEKLHDGQKDWKRHAPVLFPIVGSLKNGETLIGGKLFKMGQHGFARDMVFEEKGENSYVLKYNAETLEKYPYKFELYISYEVSENCVVTKYKVKNIDNKTIYFGLGGHPAFVCNHESCEIEFEKTEDEIEFYQLENGLINSNCEDKNKFMKENKIILNENYFDNDAVIMKKIKSNIVTLKENGKTLLKFDFSDFPILAIWSKKGANFLCIEPWMNTADAVDSDGIYQNKEGICSLEAGEELEVKYVVEFF